MKWMLLAAVCCAWALLGPASTAHAQVFSPGALTKDHKAIDGVLSCTKCHIEGGQHDNGKCLECHTEIARRLDADSGYHRTVKARVCAECHREHRGVSANLIDWVPSRDAFNHALTGWPLVGAHKKPSCKDCHEPRRIKDDEIKTLMADKDRESWLGVPTKCGTCHFDEHRGQEGVECQGCHTTDDFKKAPGFDHNDRDDSRFALVGKHRKVGCKGCHEVLLDSKASMDAFPKPREAYYLQMKDVPHASCQDCHDDPHRGSFGRDCARCHTPDGWRLIKDTAQDTGFHDKHAFKLRGEHTGVACKSCHGPFEGQPAKFKGVKFGRCADCHPDGHVGQIALDGPSVKCEACHEVTGFVPVTYDLQRHQTTRFPLENTHATVACNLCHSEETRLLQKVPKAVRADMERRRRRVLVSTARISIADAFTKDGKPTRCESCHEVDDPHGGQFIHPTRRKGEAPLEVKSCNECHQTTSFGDLKFDHAKSRFPITGKHTAVGCAGCHLEGKKGRTQGIVVYRPMSLRCESCHVDVHVGQLADKNGDTDCGACHETSGFKPNQKFDHDTQAAFPLQGAHKPLKCAVCHPGVDVEGTSIARYKPVPIACGGCHEDEHKGSFDAFDPRSVVLAGSKPDPNGRCEGCHTADAWWPARFAHERTLFPLSGRHSVTVCASCHENGFAQSLPRSCADCHRDPHGQEFGNACTACHSTDKFAGPTFAVEAHRKNNFPLNGRHAVLPCDECHVEKRERGFTRVAVDCVSCHAKDARAASIVTVNHGLPPFNISCRLCHSPVAFSPSRFPQHDVCFPISKGVHAPVSCNGCHANIPGSRFTGDCKGLPVLCAECHDHRAQVEAKRHLKVPGYEHRSEKCAACHQVSR